MTNIEMITLEVNEERCDSAHIGSDADFIERRKQEQAEERWSLLDRRESKEKTSTKRSARMRVGYHEGYAAAAQDYASGKASVEHLEQIREGRDVTDFHAIGFELGYLRKLSDLLLN